MSRWEVKPAIVYAQRERRCRWCLCSSLRRYAPSFLRGDLTPIFVTRPDLLHRVVRHPVCRRYLAHGLALGPQLGPDLPWEPEPGVTGPACRRPQAPAPTLGIAADGGHDRRGCHAAAPPALRVFNIQITICQHHYKSDRALHAYKGGRGAWQACRTASSCSLL